MSLRRRLVAAVLALVAVALAVAGVVTYAATRSFLLDRIDQQLNDAVEPLGQQLQEQAHRPPGFPGSHHDGPNLTTLPFGTFASLSEPDGDSATINVGYPNQAPPPAPKLPADLGVKPGEHRVFEADAVDGPTHFRALAVATADGTKVVVAIPTTDLHETLNRLRRTELLVGAGVLVVLGLVATLTVRRSLKPLDTMGETAGRIAAGDLTLRVEPAEARTEVGRLGLALNGMLGQIESAFAERTASENRLRRFVADASHELRTPLTSIRGYAELFRRGASERPEDLATSMRRIEEEAARMGVLVDDMLLLARLDQGRPLDRAPVDLVRLAEDAVADARVAAPDRTITFDEPSPGTAALVDGDDFRLRQVAANLLANARTHTPAGTPVRVRVVVDDTTAALEVADQGPGIPPEDLGRVFERFYRSDRSRSRAAGAGTGLGLSIVAAIVTAHGGTVSVETPFSGGATFRVALPLAGTHQERNEPMEATMSTSKAQSQ